MWYNVEIKLWRYFVMRKTFEMDYGNGKELEEFDIDYIVLFGAYDNEHPESHYNNRKSKRQVYDTIEEARKQQT